MLKSLLVAALFINSLVFANIYEVKPANSKVEFSITKFKINDDVKGEFKDFKGNYKFDEKTLALSDLNIVIPVNSISTGEEKRDEHLKTDPMFFDTAKFSEMKFVTTEKSVTTLKLNKAVPVKGMLTIKDVTKEVDLMVTYLGVKDGQPQFKGATEINRNDYGVTYNKEYKGEVSAKLKAMFANKVLADKVKISIVLN